MFILFRSGNEFFLRGVFCFHFCSPNLLPMKIHFLLIAFIAASIITLASCKKHKNEGAVLCNGNGSSSWFPLAIGDARYIATDTVITMDSITGQSGSYYYEAYGAPAGPFNYDTLHIAANGDVYTKNPYYAIEHLLVPANPLIGQTWSYADTTGTIYILTVKSLTVSLATSSCLYVNCLEIQDSINSNNVKNTFYQKGIGLVQAVSAAGPSYTQELIGLSLH